MEYWDLIPSIYTKIGVSEYHPGIQSTGISFTLYIQKYESENITQAHRVLGSHSLYTYKHRSQRISPRNTEYWDLIPSILTNTGVREYYPGIQSTGISFPLYLQTQESENITQEYRILSSHLLLMYKHRSQRISPRHTEYWDLISSECTNIWVKKYHPGIPNTGISSPLNVQTQESENITQAYVVLGSHLLWMYVGCPESFETVSISQ